MSLLPVVTTQQAAEILGVSASRVRQLCGEGALRPASRAERTLLFWRSEVAAYASGPLTSLTARTMPPLSEPMRLVVDTVLTNPARCPWDLGEAHSLHVRIYRSDPVPAPQAQPLAQQRGRGASTSPRTVVVLSEPIGDGLRILTTRIERIAEVVSERFLNDPAYTGDPVLDAVWVDVTPPRDGFSQAWSTGVTIRNILLSRPEARWRTAWAPMTVHELELLLGAAQIDWFEWNSYTPELIGQWQRARRPVEVTVDPKGLRPGVLAYQSLDGVTHPGAETARNAILYRLAGLDGIAPVPWSSEVGDNKGAEEAPTINTTVRRDFHIPTQIRDLLPDTSQAPGSTGQLRHDAECLQAWLDKIDQWSDSPDVTLSQAVRIAVEAASTREKRAHSHQPNQAEAIGDFVLTTVHLLHRSWDQEYLQQITWQATDPADDTRLALSERRLIRQLNAHASKHDADGDAQVGRDVMGNWVVRSGRVDQSRESTTCTIAWPTLYGDSPLPPGVQVVAVGDDGDRPVYLARHGRLIGLLPQTGEFSPWNFGYFGGGPANLEHAIRLFLQGAGLRVDETVIHRIAVAVEQAPQDELSISVDSLISPYRD